MQALVFDGQLRLDTDDPDPQPRPGEALIRVSCAGICNTDVEITKGYMGFSGVLGHEFVGVVEAADEPAWLGKRVVGDINCACGSCAACRAGRPHHCPHRSVLGIVGRDGALAEKCCLPVQNLFEAPDAVPDEEAVFVEPLAAAFEILEQVEIAPEHRVAVLGDGKLGLLVAQVLATTGCDLVAVGKHESKLGILAARGIATALASDLPPGRFDVVAECTGTAAGFGTSLSMVRPRGTLVLKSTVAGGREMDLAPIVVDEITVVGSRCGPFEPAIDALVRRQVSVRELISARFPLANGLAAFDRARSRGAIKVLVDMG